MTGVAREEKQAQRRLIALRSIPILLLFLSILLFGKEIAAAGGFFLALFKGFFLGEPIPGLSLETSVAILVVLFNFFISFSFFFLIWLWLVSFRALLPVTTTVDKFKTTAYLLLYILRSYGPAVFIKDGRIKADYKELFRDGSGVVVVDFNSAVVLEKKVLQPGCMGLLMGVFKIPRDLMARLNNRPAKPGSYESTQVCGPGVTFTKYGERIRGVGDLTDEADLETICGVVDLRSQYRVNQRELSKQPEKTRNMIHGYTRDGIELTTNIWALFTIGQDPEPDALQVTYAGEHRMENLRVVNLEVSPDKKLWIKSLDDTLDLEDKREIHQFARIAGRMGTMKPYEALPARSDKPEFNSGRVFSAVFSRARTRDDQVIPWNDLPTRVAIDYFREFLSLCNYSQLYRPEAQIRLPVNEVNDLLAQTGEGAGSDLPSQAPVDGARQNGSQPGIYPAADSPAALGINKLRSQLRVALRNQGLLSYRVLYPASGKNIKAGHRYSNDQILVSEIRPLTSPKVLRDRGIKIIANGFDDLIPVSKTVYQQQLDSWRATWQRDTVETQAAYELEAVRIQNKARAQAQRELTHSLSQILQNTDYSQEVLAIRIFQALETLATEPTTRQLLPADTINLMRTVHDWLLPGDVGFQTLPKR